MGYLKLETDETYLIEKVKREDRRILQIHLSEPMTPTMARRRSVQNELIELIGKRDRYILKFRKKEKALLNKIYSSDSIENEEMTKEERRLFKENWDNLRSKDYYRTRGM